jgi:hypothetical protein
MSQNPIWWLKNISSNPIQCNDCNMWKHTSCYGYLNEAQLPDIFNCYTCTKFYVPRSTASNSRRNMAEIRARMKLRKALYFANQNTAISPFQLSHFMTNTIRMEPSSAHYNYVYDTCFKSNSLTFSPENLESVMSDWFSPAADILQPSLERAM